MRPYLDDRRSDAGGHGGRGAGRRAPMRPTWTAPRRRCSALVADTREQRRPSCGVEVARALGPRHAIRAFRPLLVPLMYDADSRRRARGDRAAPARLGGDDFLFVPPLVVAAAQPAAEGRRRARCWSATARTSCRPLAYFLRDHDEDIWVRRHVPSTLALIPSQASLEVLVAALDDADGFLRYKAVAALERICGATARSGRSIAAVVERQILRRGRARVQRADAAPQPVRAGGLDTTRCWRARSRRSTSARSTASSGCSAWCTRPTTSPPCARARSRATRALRSGAIEYPRQPADRRRAPARDAAGRGHAGRRARAQGQRHLQDARARRRGHASRSSSTTTTR